MTPEAQHDAWECDGYPREWENIDPQDMSRMPVPGGWIVHSAGVVGDTTGFIPDPTHRWKLAD